jgi:HTH-type transcriptional regulator/antitoxin HigA
MAENIPFVNIGPGEMLKEELDFLGWSQEDFASIIGMSLKGVNELLNDKTALTVETAKLIAKALGTSPEAWLALDAAFRLQVAEETEREREAEGYASIMRYMPVREMVKKGWLAPFTSAKDLMTEVCQFWDRADADLTFLAKAKAPCFRRSRNREAYENYFALAWAQRARRIAVGSSLRTYDKAKARTLGTSIPELSMKPDGIMAFVKGLDKAGIGFLVQSHLQKTYLDGAAFFVASNPHIVYTGRYDRSDNFWFTMAHELAHVVLGHVRRDGDGILDDLRDEAEGAKENATDILAREYMRVPKILEFCKPFKHYLSRDRIERCSDSLGLDPGIVVGALQHAGFLPYKNLNSYKTPVLEKITDIYKHG